MASAEHSIDASEVQVPIHANSDQSSGKPKVTTSLAEPAGMGATKLTVNETDGFVKYASIKINPRGENKEKAVILEINAPERAIVLRSATLFSHQSGEQVEQKTLHFLVKVWRANPALQRVAKAGGRLMLAADVGSDSAVLAQLAVHAAVHPRFFATGVTLFCLPYATMVVLLASPLWRRANANNVCTKFCTTLGSVVAFPVVDVLLVTRYLFADTNTIDGQFGDFIAYYERLRFLVENLEGIAQTVFAAYISSTDPEEFGVSAELLAFSVTAAVCSLLKNLIQLIHDASKRPEKSFKQKLWEHCKAIARAGIGILEKKAGIAAGAEIEVSYTGKRLIREELEQLRDALLSSSCVLQKLSLSDCSLNDKSVTPLLDALAGNDSLTELDISGNDRITVQRGKELWSVIRQKKNIEVVSAIPIKKLMDGKETSLHLSHKNQCDCEMGILSEILLLPESAPYGDFFSAPLSKLVLGGNKGISALSREWGYIRRSFEVLNQNKGISRVGLDALGKGIASPGCQLRELGLAFCELDDAAIQAFSAHLPSMAPLQSLDLSLNKITDKGVEALAAQLSSAALKSLDLRENSITAEGGQALWAVLKDNNTLQTFGEIPLQDLRNGKLEKLDLLNQHLGDCEAVVLAGILPFSAPLKYLNLWDNKITDRGVEALAAVLSSAPLETLGISDNKLSDSGKTNLKSAWAKAGKKTDKLQCNSRLDLLHYDQ